MQFISFKCPLINSTDEIVFINKSLASRTPIIIIASNYPVSHNCLKSLIIQIFFLKIVQFMIVFMAASLKCRPIKLHNRHGDRWRPLNNWVLEVSLKRVIWSFWSKSSTSSRRHVAPSSELKL